MDELVEGWTRQRRLNGDDIAQQTVLLCLERLGRGPLSHLEGWMADVGRKLLFARFSDALRYTGWSRLHQRRAARARVPLTDAHAATLRASSDPEAEGYARHVLRQVDPRLVMAAVEGGQDGSLSAVHGFSYASITRYRRFALALMKVHDLAEGPRVPAGDIPDPVSARADEG